MRLAGMLGAVLAVFVLGASPAAAAEDALSPGQKRAVEEVVREYLRRNPEVLLEAMGRYAPSATPRSSRRSGRTSSPCAASWKTIRPRRSAATPRAT